MNFLRNIFLYLFLMGIVSCHINMNNQEWGSSDTHKKPAIMKKSFGTVDNKEVFLYTLQNANGIKVSITNYGGIITSILTPDK
ncbi:MAG: hypothetical protein PHP04_03720, partial [Bacteroidales bacterium]|nr:hypothetical protein [Bacteroidales bacterium]